ncbi:MAG: hypothetical protein IJY24_00515 [Clostridia bacterium]|nr:hypothetical protein [Clostridia bacterium]
MDTLALIKEKYQGFIPAHARARLEEELELVAESSTPLFFELIGRIVKAAFANGGEAMTTGNVSSSFLAYLLGAHNVNPLPPHYFCPICGRLELVPEAKSGFDLEEKICCSKPMIRDGHGLSASIYKPFFKDSSIFSLRVSDNVAALAGEMVEEFYSLHPEIERSEHRFVITPAEEQNVLSKLRERTGVEFDSLPTEEVMEAFRSLKLHGIYRFGGDVPREVLSLTQPESFNELVRSCSVYHGTGSYVDSGKNLLISGHSINDIITSKDDIFDYALAHGCSFTVAELEMMRAATGFYFDKSREEINERCQYSPEWTEALSKISYLSSRGIAISGILVAIRMMKYKLAYPDLFADLTLIDGTAP